MTQTTPPEHDKEREALARKVFELMTHGGQITEGERLRKDSRSYAIADFILAHTAKAVEEAERAARLDELGNMTFIDRDGAQTFMPFTQYRCTKDGLLLSWEDRIAQLTTPTNTSNTLEDEVKK